MTVKTHFPHLHGNPNIDSSTTNDHFPMAVLLLRNPADAIPGFHNYLYEIENNLPGHSEFDSLYAQPFFLDEHAALQNDGPSFE